MGNDRPVLTGERVILRSPREQDKLDRLACGVNTEYRRMVGADAPTQPLTPEAVARWYDEVCAAEWAWMIEAAGRCIGTARLHGLEEKDRRAKYAIGIFDPAYWGQGLGGEATQLVLGYAFDVLRLYRIELRVLAYNVRAIACYEKCGFVREGVAREAAQVDGRWEDDWMMAVLAQDYRGIGSRG